MRPVSEGPHHHRRRDRHQDPLQVPSRRLEENDFEVLPGPTVVKGFLRTYASLSEARHRAATDRVPEPVRVPQGGHRAAAYRHWPSSRARGPARSARRAGRGATQRGYVAAGVIAVLVVIVLAWLGSGRGQSTGRYRREQPPTTPLPRPRVHDGGTSGRRAPPSTTVPGGTSTTAACRRLRART